MRQIILIAHNIRSCHNVGSLLRTADGLGVEKVYLSGYTPYPKEENDGRLPHLAAKISRQINKTALGAEESIAWGHTEDIGLLINKLQTKGYSVAALEQSPTSKVLNEFTAPDKIALVVGNEADGLDAATLKMIDTHLEIPMLGAKESFNVASAAAMALFYLCYLAR